MKLQDLLSSLQNVKAGSNPEVYVIDTQNEDYVWPVTATYLHKDGTFIIEISLGDGFIPEEEEDINDDEEVSDPST